jgi:hypothetical protein
MRSVRLTPLGSRLDRSCARGNPEGGARHRIAPSPCQRARTAWPLLRRGHGRGAEAPWRRCRRPRRPEVGPSLHVEPHACAVLCAGLHRRPNARRRARDCGEHVSRASRATLLEPWLCARSFDRMAPPRSRIAEKQLATGSDAPLPPHRHTSQRARNGVIGDCPAARARAGLNWPTGCWPILQA